VSSHRERAIEIYQQHQALLTTDRRLFRKTVMDQLQSELKISVASAATHYNSARQHFNPDTAAPADPTVRVIRPGGTVRKKAAIKPDDQCYAVMELTADGSGSTVVGRYRSFLERTPAENYYQTRMVTWPNSTWVLVNGLGPNSGDPYRLSAGERELRRYSAAT